MKQKFEQPLLILPVILCGLFCLNYMFFNANGLKWPGLSPIIQYSINPGSISVNSADATAIVETIETAAFQWFQTGGAKFGFWNSSRTEKYYPESPNSISCEIKRPFIKQNRTVKVFGSSRFDPDCTGTSCVFIWSCSGDNEIRHADVQINNYNFEWNLKTNAPGRMVLKSEMLHAFGHILGLDHCSVGESKSECKSRKGAGTGNPDSDSVMHKMGEKYTQNNPGDDDRNGVRALYGALDLPFPSAGLYRLSPADSRAILEQMELEYSSGLNTEARRRLAADSGWGLAEFAAGETGRSLEQLTNEFYDAAILTVSNSTSEELAIGRKLITIGMYATYRMKTDASAGKNNWSVSLLELVLTKQRALRKTTIDAQQAFK